MNISNISRSSALLLMMMMYGGGDVKVVKDDIRDRFSLEVFPMLALVVVIVVGDIDGMIAS